MANMFVKKGDTVVVISGTQKGTTGKVLEVSPKNNKVLIEGVNIVTKHQKQRSQQEKGGIIKKPAFINASKVMVVCPETNKASRVKSVVVDGKKVRASKKSGCVLDKEVSKKAKKAVKAEKASAVESVEVEKEVVKKAPAKKTTTTTKTTAAKTTTTTKKAPAKKAEDK